MKEAFYGSVTVGERGQIVIPANARRDFSIKSKDKLVVLKGMGKMGIILVPADQIANFFSNITKHIGKISKIIGKKGGGKG